MIYEAAPPGDAPVRAGLIGVGEFGRSLLAQSRAIPALTLPVLCDRDPARAADACREIVGGAQDVLVCASRRAALAAIEAGGIAVVEDGALLMDLPVDIVVEATGEPEVAAANAAAALDHGKHVAMVSKEADCVVGPILDRTARRAGLVHTPVDGDQPALLIRLVAWARGLGLEIVAAGKSSEYDFVLDPVAETVTVRGQRVEAKGFGQLWTLAPGGIEATLRARAEALAALPQRTAPDFCEMAIVANGTGLCPDNPGFHAPILRPLEIPGVLCPRSHGGLLERSGAIDVFNCLRRPDEASFAGGVFVVVRCAHAPTWALLRGKGIPVSADGAHALLYHPSHLLGVEAPRSIIAAVRQGRSSGGAEVRPVCDLVGRATRTLPAGTLLTLGERHTLAGLEPRLVDAGTVGDHDPLPYYMAAGRTLCRDVPAGAMVTREAVAPPGPSVLWRLRAEQDAAFQP